LVATQQAFALALLRAALAAQDQLRGDERREGSQQHHGADRVDLRGDARRIEENTQIGSVTLGPATKKAMMKSSKEK
jgi:hypothetical protein